MSYPIVGINNIDVLYSKEENKYRINQFFDITKDRGEFSGNDVQMWNTHCDGVHKDINPLYVKYGKKALQHKKFRHYGNKLLLRKTNSDGLKFVLKLVNSKHLNSSR